MNINLIYKQDGNLLQHLQQFLIFPSPTGGEKGGSEGQLGSGFLLFLKAVLLALKPNLVSLRGYWNTFDFFLLGVVGVKYKTNFFPKS